MATKPKAAHKQRRKPAERVIEHKISVPFSLDHIAAIDKRAQHEGITRSAFIRAGALLLAEMDEFAYTCLMAKAKVLNLPIPLVLSNTIIGEDARRLAAKDQLPDDLPPFLEFPFDKNGVISGEQLHDLLFDIYSDAFSIEAEDKSCSEMRAACKRSKEMRSSKN